MGHACAHRRVLINALDVEVHHSGRDMYNNRISAGRRPGDGDAVIGQLHSGAAIVPCCAVISELMDMAINAHSRRKYILVHGHRRDTRTRIPLP